MRVAKEVFEVAWGSHFGGEPAFGPAFLRFPKPISPLKSRLAGKIARPTCDNRRMRKLLAAVLLTVALPLLADDKTKLAIHVVNQSNRPVSNASVIVRFKHGLNPIKMSKIRTSWELRTSQEGLAKIPSIPKGMVQIQIIAKNYQTFGDTFDVVEDERTIEIKLNPPQSQYSAHQ